MTITPAALPGPEDLLALSPTAALFAAVAPSLVQRALNDLATRTGLDVDVIQLTRVEEAVWTSLDLGCGEVTRAPANSLEIQGYRIVLAAGGRTYEYHSDDRATVRLCQQDGEIAGRAGNLLLETDPVAAGLVGLARRRLAAELGVDVETIRLTDLAHYQWTDSGLGCAVPGQLYLPAQVEGYRIVLAAADITYIYHTDSEQLIRCAPENERLPGAAPQAAPTQSQ